MRRRGALAWVLGVLWFCAPAAAQGVPEALRGTWAMGTCAAPEALLHVTARGTVRLPAEGPARLLRFHGLGAIAGWTLGTGGGAEAPRMLLRAEGEMLATLEPDPKTRDDRLPGDGVALRWHRCAAPPPALAVLHGEGLAFLGTLERLEAACQGGTTAPCLAMLVAEGDVSGDGMLGVAELARLLRGAAWALAVQDGAMPEAIGAASGFGAVAGTAAARLIVEALDFNGDGRLSLAEIGQDRAAFAAGTGDAAGRPVVLETLAEGAGLLRALIERLGSE